ncbi:MAG: C4-dicarboxylate ABC transporter, partial [Actinotalea sp.]|nr:C4-dicarboxylate ABC transporter [Actinotalea sp.]
MAPDPGAAASPQRLEHLPVTFFAVVMGLGGLALAWLRAADVLGAPSAVGVVLFWVATTVYAAILVAYLLKLVRHPAAVRAEIAHPVRIAFVPTVSIGLLLLAAAGRAVVPGVATALWWVGAAAQLVLTLAVINAWIQRPVFAMVHVSPAWFIPVVGNLVVPLAGASLAPAEVSW